MGCGSRTDRINLLFESSTESRVKETTVPPIDAAYTDTDPRSPILRRLLLALYVIAGAVYLAWRATVFNPEAIVISWIFYVVEFAGFLSSVLLFFVTLQRRTRRPRPAPAGLTVDVFVTTRNEDIDIVRRTLVAAVNIRYPHKTWLLDDGDRAVFRLLAAELGCRYLARTDNTGAKAGNLNNALGQARGDFVAVFDADHCPDPTFLDRLLGYFDDRDVAFVQTPQDYYNLDSFQHGRGRTESLIWHEQSGFHHVEQPGRDHHDAATLCGCSCILRRAHLDRIGGFPIETVTEDMHAAVKLQKLGLKTVYHDEPLAFGVAPPDLRGFLLQRLRWGEGNMQVCRIERLPFARQLTWRQNLCYLLLGFAYLDAWRKLAMYVAPIWTLIRDEPPVFGAPMGFVLFFVPYFLIGLITYLEFYSGFGRVLRTEAYAMARLGAALTATWGLFRRRINFRISSKRLVAGSAAILALPQALILIGGLIAIADAGIGYVEYRMGLRPASIPPAIVLVLVILVAYHCALALGVLVEVIRSSRINETNYRFDLCLPVHVVGTTEHVAGWTRVLSIDGATVDVECPADFPTGCAIEIAILVPGGTLPIRAQVQSRSDTSVELRFMWDSLAARDALDQMLHASRWHRVVGGKYEVTLSPFERIGVLTPPPARRPQARAPWEPVVIRLARQDNKRALAYMMHDPFGKPMEMLTFHDIEPHICVIAARRPETLGHYQPMAIAGDAILDEIALASLLPRRLRIAPAAVDRSPTRPHKALPAG